MSGLVGNLVKKDIEETQQAAAGEAMNKNDFHDVKELDEWSFFTAHDYLTFFTGELVDGECVENFTADIVRESEGWVVAVFDPEREVEGVRKYLRGQWDAIPVDER